MGVYLDAEDIEQHFRQSGALDIETIEEVMEEQEYYVQTRLRLPQLPPDNPILRDIIRDLTIAKGIYRITPANADNLIKADSQERSALRKLRELETGGLGIIGGKLRGEPSTEVYNPIYGTFFPLSDWDV